MHILTGEHLQGQLGTKWGSPVVKTQDAVGCLKSPSLQEGL